MLLQTRLLGLMEQVSFSTYWKTLRAFLCWPIATLAGIFLGRILYDLVFAFCGCPYGFCVGWACAPQIKVGHEIPTIHCAGFMYIYWILLIGLFWLCYVLYFQSCNSWLWYCPWCYTFTSYWRSVRKGLLYRDTPIQPSEHLLFSCS